MLQRLHALSEPRLLAALRCAVALGTSNVSSLCTSLLQVLHRGQVWLFSLFQFFRPCFQFAFVPGPCRKGTFFLEDFSAVCIAVCSSSYTCAARSLIASTFEKLTPSVVPSHCIRHDLEFQHFLRKMTNTALRSAGLLGPDENAVTWHRSEPKPQSDPDNFRPFNPCVRVLPASTQRNKSEVDIRSCMPT